MQSHARPRRPGLTLAILSIAAVSYVLQQMLVVPALPTMRTIGGTIGGQVGAAILSADVIAGTGGVPTESGLTTTFALAGAVAVAGALPPHPPPLRHLRGPRPRPRPRARRGPVLAVS